MRKKRQPVLLLTALSVAFGLFIRATPLFAADQENVLYSFNGHTPPRHDGADPGGSLIFDASGNLYGATNSGGIYGFGTVFELKFESRGRWTKTVLHNFAENVGGFGPVGNLIFDGKGSLYGTTVYGGSTSGSGCHGSGCGTVFQLTLGAGGKWTYRVVHNFGKGSDGQQPSGGLTFDAGGNLYGFTTEGGALGGGAVYQLTPGADGQWTEKVLYNFSGGVDWQDPEGTPVFDAAGNLYGVTVYGDTAFKLAPRANGEWHLEVLHTFGTGSDGLEPIGGLIFDADGNLYGATLQGGTNGLGTVFKLTPSRDRLASWTETVLVSFDGKHGWSPRGGLILDATGNLYGTTFWGGASGSSCDSYGCGIAFQLTPNGGTWTEKVLHSFGKGTDGNSPSSGLIFDTSGNLYGVTVEGGEINWGIVFQLSPATNGKWTETVLHSFGRGIDGADGANSFAGLIVDTSGNLYGSTAGGGNPTACGGHDCGTIFKLGRNKSGHWSETQLHAFQGRDGANPYGNLTFDAAGNLYGNTSQGGAFYPCGGMYCSGAVFKLAPRNEGRWTETVIHSFGSDSDGQDPSGGLSFDTEGNLYGLTSGGGAYGGGTVFELMPGANGMWTETRLHDFCADQGCTDGFSPAGALLLDKEGNLYGVNSSGGLYGRGNVFELVRSAHGKWTTSVLYDFTGGSDGASPNGSLIFDKAGNLYGTTYGFGGPGNVFELTLGGNGKWSETVLYTFSGDSDGDNPAAGLIFDAAGNLYGTTVLGGDLECNNPYGCGVVFKLTPGTNGTWSETVLHSFAGKDGYSPSAPVVLDNNGDLYGTTAFGGSLYGSSSVCSDSGCGTVFEIIP